LFTSIFTYIHFIEKWNLYFWVACLASQLHHVVLRTGSAFLQTITAFLQTVTAFLRTVTAFSQTIHAFSRTVSAFSQTITAFSQTIHVHGMPSQDAGKYLRDDGRL